MILYILFIKVYKNRLVSDAGFVQFLVKILAGLRAAIPRPQPPEGALLVASAYGQEGEKHAPVTGKTALNPLFYGHKKGAHISLWGYIFITILKTGFQNFTPAHPLTVRNGQGLFNFRRVG